METSRKTIKKIRRSYNRQLKGRLEHLRVQLKDKPSYVPQWLWKFGAGRFVMLEKLEKVPPPTALKSQARHLDPNDERTSEQKIADLKRVIIEDCKTINPEYQSAAGVIERIIDRAYKAGMEN